MIKAKQMAKALSPTEKLARDICWRGFNNPKNATRLSKSGYWNSIDHEARVRYLEHAAELIWWTRRLGAERLKVAQEDHDALSR